MLLSCKHDKNKLVKTKQDTNESQQENSRRVLQRVRD